MMSPVITTSRFSLHYQCGASTISQHANVVIARESLHDASFCMINMQDERVDLKAGEQKYQTSFYGYEMPTSTES